MERDDQLGEGDGLGADRGDAGLGGQLHALLDGGEREDRRRAGLEAPDAVDRVVVALHRELVALAEPAPDRRAQLRLALLRDVEVGGRAGAAVEVLVGAADRELDAVRR